MIKGEYRVDVVIKENGKYVKISIDSLLRGLEPQEERDMEVILKVHQGVTSIGKTPKGYEIRVRERNINRLLSVSSLGGISKGIEMGLNLSVVEKGYLKGFGSKWYQENGFRYESQEGVIFGMELRQERGGYRVVDKTMRVARKEHELLNGNKRLIYPNVYDSGSLICLGSTNLPVIQDFSEVGKITTAFLTSNINSDLSKLVVLKRRWRAFLNILQKEKDEVRGVGEEDIEKLLSIARKTKFNGSAEHVDVGFYLIILLVNMFGKDMDWAQRVLYEN